MIRNVKTERKLNIKKLRRFRRSNCGENLNAYLEARNDYKNLTNRKKAEFHNQQIDSLIGSINDSKSFWGKFKRLMDSKRNTKLGNISKDDWKKYFQSLFTTMDEQELQTI